MTNIQGIFSLFSLSFVIRVLSFVIRHSLKRYSIWDLIPVL